MLSKGIQGCFALYISYVIPPNNCMYMKVINNAGI